MKNTFTVKTEINIKMKSLTFELDKENILHATSIYSIEDGLILEVKYTDGKKFIATSIEIEQVENENRCNITIYDDNGFKCKLENIASAKGELIEIVRWIKQDINNKLNKMLDNSGILINKDGEE